MLTKRRIIVGKIEAVEGTAEALLVADAGIVAIDPKVTVDITMLPRPASLVTLSRMADLAGKSIGRIAFRAEVKGPGAAYAANKLPALGKYLRCCGFAETLVVTLGSESATYKPASSGLPSMTLWCYEDGVIKKLKGARGTVKFSGKVGEPFYADFDFLGVWDGAVDGALLAPTYEGTIPPLFLGASFSVAAYAAVVASFDVDFGNKLAARPDVSTVTGVKSIVLTERDPRGKFDPEMATIAGHDFIGRWTAGTPGALICGPVGAVQYNKFTITAPKLVYTGVADGEREGQAVADTSFQLAMNTGDDEFVLAFT